MLGLFYYSSSIIVNYLIQISTRVPRHLHMLSLSILMICHHKDIVIIISWRQICLLCQLSFLQHISIVVIQQ